MAINFNNSNIGNVILAPATTGSWSLQLPTALGSANQFLTTNGSGVLGYTTGSAGPVGFDAAIYAGAPNTTKNVSALTANSASTHAGVAIVARGTGAVLAAIPTGTTAGGNARGSQAIDLQRLRSASTEVASANSSVLLGGQSNTVDGVFSVVLGGFANTCTGINSVICGGVSNTIASTADRSVIFGGFGGRLGGVNSVVFGGVAGKDYNANFTAVYAGYGFSSAVPATNDGQTSLRFMPLATAPTTNVAVVLNSAGTVGSESLTNTLVIPQKCVSFVRTFTIARRNTTFGVKSWATYILVKRIGSGTITQAGSVNNSTIMATLGTATWTLTTGVNTGRNAVDLLATSAAATLVPFSTIAYVMDMPLT